MRRVPIISNGIKLSALIAMLVLILSCGHNPKVKETKEANEVKKRADSTAGPVYNKVTDDLVAFISGVGDGKNQCHPKLDSIIRWNKYADELDTMFSRTVNVRSRKMKTWADSELIKNNSIKTVFYPFSGPDFLNANVFYPDADKYILIAQEPIGSLPDICNMIPDSVKSYLNSINNSLKDIFKRSYFITKKMNNDLKKTKVNGTIPLISLFIKRTGHHIVSIQKVGVDSTGECQLLDSMKNIRKIIRGIKIEFVSPEDNKLQTVYYFRADISDKGLEKNTGFKKYLYSLPESFSYVKAASFLMHFDDFKEIRSIIFNKSLTILQDDSGIAYKYFDKSGWDIKLYGKYSKPKKEFSYISEPDLEKAYKKSTFRPVPFKLGYNWGSENVNLLYAVKKSN